MDFRRHVTAGRLSELVGETGAQTDKVVRTLGWRRVAEQELRPGSTRRPGATCEAYADGVNAYLDGRSAAPSCRPRVRRARPAAHQTTGSSRGRRWTRWPGSRRWPGTCAATRRRARPGRASRDRHDVERVDQLYPAYPYDRHPPIVGPTSRTRAGSVHRRSADHDAHRADGTRRRARARPAPCSPRPARPRAQRVLDGAQARGRRPGPAGRRRATASARTPGWSPARYTTGKPLLANDPHLAPGMPGHLVPDGPALPDAVRDLPVRRGRLHVRRRARAW